MPETTANIQKLSTFVPQRKNANKHTPRGMGMLDTAMSQDGYVAPMTATADGEIIDGSSRHEVAGTRFGDDVLVVPHDGTKPIVMVRTDIASADDPRAKRIALAANRIAAVDLAWDGPLLAELSKEVDLSPLWSKEELQEQIQRSSDDKENSLEDVEPQIDKAEELRQKWQVTSGQLWQLGEHRLLCGDSTKREDVERVMDGEKADICFTSPPYNVSAHSSLPNKEKYQTKTDDRTSEEYLALLTDFTAIALEFSSFVFVNLQSVSGNKLALIDYLYNFQKKYADSLIWDKQSAEPAMASNVLNSRFEFIHVFSEKANRSIGTKDFRGTLDNVVTIQSRQDKQFSDTHKATFPLEFAEHFIENFSSHQGIVNDPFLGSGTTLIACEKLNRKCRAIEIAPNYVAVALERWHQVAGKQPKLLN